MTARPHGWSRRDFLRAIGVTAMSVSTASLLVPKKQVIANGAYELEPTEFDCSPRRLEFYAYATQGAAVGHVRPWQAVWEFEFGSLSDPAVVASVIRQAEAMEAVRLGKALG